MNKFTSFFNKDVLVYLIPDCFEDEEKPHELQRKMSTNENNTESSTSFYPNIVVVDQISKLIDADQFDDALTYLTSLSEQEIHTSTWDICTYLFHLLEKSSDKLHNAYQFFSEDALRHLANVGNPREMLIIMLEQSDRFLSDEIYTFHIELFAILVRRLPLKPSLITSIKDILSLLQCHLTTMELPKISTDFAG